MNDIGLLIGTLIAMLILATHIDKLRRDIKHTHEQLDEIRKRLDEMGVVRKTPY
jgi:uncharacterized membrane-anchored protein YhcB (DUF1043 family)